MAKVTFEAPSEEENLVAVKLLRNYVPASTVPDHNGSYEKSMAGEVIELPRSEARSVIKAGIAVIDGDLI